MFRTRVKICGITRLEDALLACELGADAIGMVMTPTSPRCVSIERARTIREALPAFVDTVAVLVDPPLHSVQTIVSFVHPDILQFHGHEEPEFCAASGMQYIKVFSMNEPMSAPLETLLGRYCDASAIMLDGRVVGQPADGMGFDWRCIPQQFSRPLILSGGINEANVTAAIESIEPYAVDVSSGVEAAVGIKDRSKLMRFFVAVNTAGRREDA